MPSVIESTTSDPTGHRAAYSMVPLSSRAILWLLLLATGAALVRWLTRSQLIYSWDTVHYILAMDHYDLALQQPHPPGSYYYVLLARFLRQFIGDGHLTLQLISSLSGALLVVGVFFLSRALGRDHRAGWLAAVVAATAPLPWFYGALALNYAPTGAITTWFALCCVLACQNVHPGRNLVLAGALLGLVGGLRPTDVAFLTPAYLWALYYGTRTSSSLGQRGGVVGGSLVTAGLITLGWLLPSIANVDGLSEYIASIRRQDYLFRTSSVFAAGWYAFKYAVFSHRRCFEGTLGAAWLLAPVALFALRSAKQRWISAMSPEPLPEATTRQGLSLFGILLVMPAFLFYLLGHFALPGYALVYTGYLTAILCAWLTHRLIPAGWFRPPAFGAVLAGVAMGNAAVFLLGWPGVGKVEHLRLCYRELQDHDAYYRQLGEFLRAQPNPEAVTVLTSYTATDGLRVAQTLFSGFRVRQPVTRYPKLPPEVSQLPWFTLMPRDQIAAEAQSGNETFYLICRTRLDIGYHTRLFRSGWDRVRIGPEPHYVFRLHPDFTRRLRTTKRTPSE